MNPLPSAEGRIKFRKSKYDIEIYRYRRFGSRVVLDRIQDSRNGQWWLMKCDCGRIDSVNASIVLRSRAQSCMDCVSIRQKAHLSRHWRGHGAISSTALIHFMASAKKRKIEWSVDITYLDEIWKSCGGICPVSGRPMTMIRGNKYPANASLDRINSNLGYIPGNVRWVRKEVNFAKQEMTDEELIALCREIIMVADSDQNKKI